MTEVALREVTQAAALFEHHAPRGFERIDLLERGRVALAAANQRLGLALARTRSITCSRISAASGRDPTDVELMMFAQANSEHCRHKIFNAEFDHRRRARRRNRCSR